ncbi:MAG: DUF4347 domain-containing protein, partial [Pseudomonadota bacterium]
MTDFGDKRSTEHGATREHDVEATEAGQNASPEHETARVVTPDAVTHGSRALEPRILLDAAMDATIDAVDADSIDFEALQAEADQQAETNEALIAALESIEAAKEYAFIDLGVEGAEELAANFGDDVSIHYINTDTDGVEQIAAILTGASDVDAVHILSHGRSGTLDLGSTKLTEASMNGKHADEMAVIADALSENADILIYGCDFGANARGASAVQALADVTGADVAASEDLTGAADLDGDWDLEVQKGTIEA